MVSRIMFCFRIPNVELDIYEIAAMGIPKDKVMDAIKDIKAIGWFEVDINADNLRAIFTKPKIIQAYNDHLSPIITELLADAVARNKKRMDQKEEPHG